MAVILDAEFTSVWDGGFCITTKCKVNQETGRVFDIEMAEDMADFVEELDEEYITIGDQRFPVVDAIEISDVSEFDGYWY